MLRSVLIYTLSSAGTFVLATFSLWRSTSQLFLAAFVAFASQYAGTVCISFFRRQSLLPKMGLRTFAVQLVPVLSIQLVTFLLFQNLAVGVVLKCTPIFLLPYSLYTHKYDTFNGKLVGAFVSMAIGVGVVFAGASSFVMSAVFVASCYLSAALDQLQGVGRADEHVKLMSLTAVSGLCCWMNDQISLSALAHPNVLMIAMAIFVGQLANASSSGAMLSLFGFDNIWLAEPLSLAIAAFVAYVLGWIPVVAAAAVMLVQFGSALHAMHAMEEM
eukprot:TRINITY_DN12066_c0_g1_i1.p1 TRINITY_DN12066_c0_g1~~TRINITY_DN12066_c0_g1_i1.p1  ORF type:complete len:273 (-),score=41.61 TRINITY_DN12066_c0_g1_i1:182-1000(-)